MDPNADPSHDKLGDGRLIEQYRAGHEHAFDVLVHRYQQELYHFLVRFTGSRHAAEDVFQETFLQVHLSIDTFQTDKRFKPWLFTIAANKARDYLRRTNRRAALRLSAPIQGDAGEEDRQFLDLLQADLPMPDEQATLRETQERVQKVVISLPDHLREILILAYFHQFAYKEIAEMLKIPLGTVKSRLHSAVGSFADLWKRSANEPH